MNKVPKEISKAYDINDIVDIVLTNDVVEMTGHAIGSEARMRKLKSIVVIGRDSRPSSPCSSIGGRVTKKQLSSY